MAALDDTAAARASILFVDDEPNFLEGLRRMLRTQRDWRAVFVGSVDAALDTLRQSPFDAVVSDVNMPVKSGLDLIEAMQADAALRRIPIVILTGNGETNLKRRALDLGAADLLNKPVQPEDLVARLRSVLRLKEYQDRLENQNAELERRVLERTAELEVSRHDIIWRLAKAAEFRDNETGEHVIRVAQTSRLLAQALGVPEALSRQIFLTSPLHDIGKIGIPDGILLKPGPLTAAERTHMQRHCEIGAQILVDEPAGLETMLDAIAPDWAAGIKPGGDELRRMAAEIALAHHERWDGHGYPRGLAGEDIPLPARIVAVADVYDALRSTRPYKDAIDAATAQAFIAEDAGLHFDPAVAAAFATVAAQAERYRNPEAPAA